MQFFVAKVPIFCTEKYNVKSSFKHSLHNQACHLGDFNVWDLYHHWAKAKTISDERVYVKQTMSRMSHVTDTYMTLANQTWQITAMSCKYETRFLKKQNCSGISFLATKSNNWDSVENQPKKGTSTYPSNVNRNHSSPDTCVKTARKTKNIDSARSTVCVFWSHD